MRTSRAGTVAPYSMIVIGLVLAILASLAVVQSSGISVTQAAEVEQLEPKIGQLALHAPPYCPPGAFCRGLNGAINRLNAQINFLMRLADRFPELAPVVERVITTLRGIQTRLIQMQDSRARTQDRRARARNGR